MWSVFWGGCWLGELGGEGCMNVRVSGCLVASLGVSCLLVCVSVLVSLSELVVVVGRRPVGVGEVRVVAVVVLLVVWGIWGLRCWCRGDRGGSWD